MTRFFNTAGPCRPERHYMLPPERRLPEVRGLVAQESYFVLHAPRQVGKTTALRSLAESLTREGRFAAVLVSMEAGAAGPDDVGAAELAILDACADSARLALPPELQPPPVALRIARCAHSHRAERVDSRVPPPAGALPR